MKTSTKVRTAAAAVAVVAACGLGTGAYAAPVAGAHAPTVVRAGADGPSLGTVTLSELKARVIEAIDRQAMLVTKLSQRVAASERLTAEAKARIAERLAARQAALAKLREAVQAQTTKEGVVAAVRSARKDGALVRGGAKPGSDDAADHEGAEDSDQAGDDEAADHEDGDHQGGDHEDGDHESGSRDGRG